MLGWQTPFFTTLCIASVHCRAFIGSTSTARSTGSKPDARLSKQAGTWTQMPGYSDNGPVGQVIDFAGDAASLCLNPSLRSRTWPKIGRIESIPGRRWPKSVQHRLMFGHIRPILRRHRSASPAIWSSWARNGLGLATCCRLRATLFLRRDFTSDDIAPGTLVSAFIAFSCMGPPVELLSSVLRTLCNAWCTTARFDNPDASCPYACSAAVGDAVAHICACLVAVHWAATALLLVLTNPGNSVATLIRALLPPGRRAVQHALFCDVCLWATNKIRHGSLEHPLALLSASSRNWFFGIPRRAVVVL